MTRDEFSVIVNSMSDSEYTELQRSFGTTASRSDFAREFARHPEWDETLSDLLNVPTESYREAAAIKSVAKTAALSAIESHQAKAQSRRALNLSIAATVLSLVAVIIAALPYFVHR